MIEPERFTEVEVTGQRMIDFFTGRDLAVRQITPILGSLIKVRWSLDATDFMRRWDPEWELFESRPTSLSVDSRRGAVVLVPDLSLLVEHIHSGQEPPPSDEVIRVAGIRVVQHERLVEFVDSFKVPE